MRNIRILYMYRFISLYYNNIIIGIVGENVMIVDLISYQMTILTASFPSFNFFFHVINWSLVELTKSVTALTLMIF